MKRIYLDNAATTALRPEVIERMTDVLQEHYGNPSSIHSFGRTPRTIVETARKAVAQQLGCSSGEIIFTSGGTEADNMILRAAVRDLGVQRIITSKIEHHAVLHAAEQLQEEYNIEIAYVRLRPDGTPNHDHLKELVSADTSKKLVSLMSVNNEIGNKLDLPKVAALCEEYDTFFHTDAVQHIGHFPLDLGAVPIHFLAASAHKFHGPKGVGFAFIRKNSGLKPLILGGEQERGLRAGTEAVHGIAGMETAFKMAYENLEEEMAHIQGLKSYFMEKLARALPKTSFNGACASLGESTYALVNVCLPLSEEQGQVLLCHLDLNGIACSAGSACQSGSAQTSHVLMEILDEKLLKRPSIRFSFSVLNTEEEIDRTIEVLHNFAMS